ncbi:hypothetical protein ACFYM2_23680 [Streptomyces sp. NPDC006711]|uniref:hypothetical protein n=1 Tax=unclassified Streptomyces TaxID=2593676 RepID=UPI0033CC33FF
MTPSDELRLLPWSSPDGKPCYLSTDNPAGRLSRLADEVEAVQLDLAHELMRHALDLLAVNTINQAEIRRVSETLIEALGGALRVAALRGHRLASLGAPPPAVVADFHPGSATGMETSGVGLPPLRKRR